MSLTEATQLYLQDIALNGKINETLTIRVPDLKEMIISFPKKKLEDLKNIKEINYSGIYFLWAKNKKKVYIGQASNKQLKIRLKSHYEEKDWWNRCIFVTTTDNTLDNTDLNYLEYTFIEKAKDLDNNTEGTKSGNISESKKEHLNSIIKNIFSILEIIRIDIFLDKNKDPHRKWTEKISKEKFYLEGFGCDATIIWRKRNKVIVQKNSKLASNYLESREYELKAKARKYSNNGFIKDKNVVRDISFETLNEAATFCYRGAINVWKRLKNKEGESLDKICKEIYANS